MELNEMYEELGISEKVLKFGTEIEESLKERFEAIDENAEYNQMKVLKAMQEARVSDIHFAATTGYGYNDLGRDTLEEVYAKAFHGEDALVRPQLPFMWHYPAICVRAMSCSRRLENRMIPSKRLSASVSLPVP